MAKVTINAEVMADMLFPGATDVRIRDAAMGKEPGTIDLTIEGTSVPDADRVVATITVRATKYQRFSEASFEAV